jgi:hypothetical protein
MKTRAMKLRYAAVAAAAAAALAAGTGIAAAAPHATATKLTYVATQSKMITYSRTTGAANGTLTQSGKLTGFFELSFTFTKTSGTADLAADINGGLLYAALKLSATNNNASGPITGGTGKYAGAKGTVVAKATGKNTHLVTITYTG